MFLMKQLRRRQLNLRAVDAVLSVWTKSVNLGSSLREARPLVEADLREIDIEKNSIVSG